MIQTENPSARKTAATIPSDAHVLEGHDLRSDFTLSATSRFGDEIWDLNPINHQAHLRSSILNFPTLPAQFLAVTKELFYHLLTGELPPGEIRLKQFSVRSVFGCVKKFLVWADERGHCDLASMADDDFEAYQQWLLATDLSPSQRGLHRRSARAFWLFRDGLHTDRLTRDPQRLLSWQSDNCQPPDRLENSTERIPEEVISPLLMWALRWVNDFSADILGAHHEWWRLYTARQIDLRRPRSQPRPGASLAALQRLIESYRQAQRPLPGNGDGTVRINFLARQLGLDPSFMRIGSGRPIIEAAAAELGVDRTAFLFTQPTTLLDGQTWLSAFEYATFNDLCKSLQTACYIVIAYLSGMRDSEVKHLERGCLTRQRDTDGRTCRRHVTSTAFKGEATARGVTATWVVSASVEKAVSVLEQLQPKDQKYLFHNLRGGTSYRAASGVVTTSATNRALNEFATSINDYCLVRGRPDGIPLVRRQHWRLTTGQFRRTLAWFIARRPGGVIAGSIQYRHYSIQMFEGYAGTSASGFRGEVEAERSLQRGETLLTMIDNHEHQQLRGPAANEARARLDGMRRNAAYTANVVTDRRRLVRLMRREDPHIYPGQFVTCVYDPHKALCRNTSISVTAESSSVEPDLTDCDPLHCRNVALTAGNIDALNRHLHMLGDHLARADTLAPYVADRLRTQHRELTELLGRAPKDNR